MLLGKSEVRGSLRTPLHTEAAAHDWIHFTNAEGGVQQRNRLSAVVRRFAKETL